MDDQALTTGERLRRKNQLKKPVRVPGRETALGNLIVIGASAGGHSALIEVIKSLATDIPAAVVIAYHGVTTSSFVFQDWIKKFTSLPVVGVQKEVRLSPGVVFVSPPGQAIFVRRNVLHVERHDRGTHRSGTIDCLFDSAAKVYGKRVIGVVLTGLLNDGSAGLRTVHMAGGLTIVQDPKDAEYPDMPANAMKDLPVTFCLNLAEIGPTLELLARRKAHLETGVAVSVRMLKNRAALLVRLIGQSKQNVDTYRFLSEELIGLEHELQLIRKLLQDALIKNVNVHGKKVLNKILHAAMKLTSADMGNIQLLDPLSNTLRVVAHKGFKQPFLDFFARVSPQEASACGTALKLHEQTIVEDVARSPIFVGTPALSVLHDAGVRAVLSTPLITHTGLIIGMLSTHDRTPRRPTQGELANLDKLLSSSAGVIEALQLQMGTPSSDI